MKDSKPTSRLAAGAIQARGVRVNNLKNISVDIPRGSLTVVTGLSGSGKSSLAFDTLYAEGQRRYVESLSSYARQFMGKMKKPEVDFIKGLPPAIAIEQKTVTRNPRSTVGTSTEIYDYMRLLFGRIGRIISPVSGTEVKKHTINDVFAHITSLPEGTRVALTAAVTMPEKRRVKTHLEVLVASGYWRLVHDGDIVDIADMLADEPSLPPSLEGWSILIDRTTASADMPHDEASRLLESIENAFFEGHGALQVMHIDAGGSWVTTHFSNRLEADGLTFEEPSDMTFNFNSPYGACPRCEGFGKVIGLDERLVVPNPALSLYEDAVVCWRGEKMSEWKNWFIRGAARYGFPVHTPYKDLTPQQKKLLWEGNSELGGIRPFFKMVDQNLYKIQYRVMKARYQGKTLCPECNGSRLGKKASYVKVGGKTISELTAMSVNDLAEWFAALTLTPNEQKIAERPLEEIRSRLLFMQQVGLGYLTIDRQAATLSGGESQRINLACSLGSSLIGSLYILDEPSIGLHSRDTQRLIKVLRNLQRLGNTVVIVEHDEEIMRAADHIIDVGPEAGRNGGTIVYAGPAADIGSCPGSYTARYLDGTLQIPVPGARRHSSSHIEVKGACEHNLKNIDVKFPLGVLTVVSGVSGSGKSTLVRDILYRSLCRALGQVSEAPGAMQGLAGDVSRIKRIDFIDQNPIGKSSRSNPATYLGAYDEIRKLFAAQQMAKQLDLKASSFSFNTDGGRCPECKGEGSVTIEMQFMADVVIPCESCHGKRFKSEVLEVTWQGKNIDDVLNMTVDEAIDFFSLTDGSTERKIVRRLRPLQEVGLGYISLGQSSSSLSGGENQRVKLAAYLASETTEPTMFIFDEPTTGLHFNDIKTLLKAFDRLLAQGHTIVVIEHNIDVIKTADHVIDIGPEGGDAGGYLVCQGTPEEVAACRESYTGRFLAEKLTANPK